MSNVRPMIRELSKYVSQLAKETNDNLTDLVRQVNRIDDLLEAIIEVVGKEKVQDAISAIVAARIKGEEEAQEKAIQMLVERQVLVPAETIDGDVMVTGTDTYLDGKVRSVRFEFGQLKTEAAAKFVGRKVGDVIAEESVPTFTVTGIYTINREVAKAHAKAEKEALQNTGSVN